MARLACRLPVPMLLLLPLILHWAIMMYDDFYAVILHVDNFCEFLRMVLDDRLGWSAVNLLVKILYVLSNRTRLRHLPGSISLTVGLYIIIGHSFIHFLNTLIHERGFKFNYAYIIHLRAQLLVLNISVPFRY